MPPMSAASIITYCWPRRVQSSASSSASTTAFRTWDQYSNLSTATRSPWFSKRSVRRAAKLHGTHASATSAIAAPCPHLPTRSTARIRTQARRCGPAFPAGREIFVVHTQKLRAALDEARLARVGAEGLAAAERVLLVREDLEVAIGQAMMANAANCSACGALHEQQR